jgi:rubrerythrin
VSAGAGGAGQAERKRSMQPKQLMTPGEVLRAALTKERAAHRFYAQLEERSRASETVLELVTTLKNEEAKHVKMVEEWIARMNLGRI